MKEINNARDIFPNCSSPFMCGVHSYLKGDDMPVRPIEDEFIQGYYTAEANDLRNKYKLK